MQQAALSLFVLCAFWIAYVYAIYPAFLLVLGLLRRRPKPPPLADDELPKVGIFIPAYNEEAVIAEKLESTLALDYPAKNLEITVASDRSSDATDAIVRGYAERGVRLIRNETQRGKIATISDLASRSTADVILITDANAIFEPDALRKVVAHFRDPKVGIVDGNRLLHRTPTMVGDGEGAYWRYETMLRRADSDVFSTTFINGAMTAIRRELFLPLPSYLEFDHVLPLHVINQGRRVVFENEARFYEETAPSSKVAYRIRVRNAVRGFTMVLLIGRYLNVLRHPLFTFHLLSRKVLRWLVAVPAIGLLAANFFLLDVAVFRWTLAAQAVFYVLALLGGALDRVGVKQGMLALPYYFCLVNAASLVGFLKAVCGQRMATWSTGR